MFILGPLLLSIPVKLTALPAVQPQHPQVPRLELRLQRHVQPAYALCLCDPRALPRRPDGTSLALIFDSLRPPRLTRSPEVHEHEHRDRHPAQRGHGKERRVRRDALFLGGREEPGLVGVRALSRSPLGPLLVTLVSSPPPLTYRLVSLVPVSTTV